MRMDRELIHQVLGLEPGGELQFEQLGWADSALPGTLSFLDDERFMAPLLANDNIVAAFVTEPLRAAVAATGRATITCDDPRWYYYTLHNHIAHEGRARLPSRIDPTARIHARAYVAEHNVVIGAGTIVEPNVTILEDVVIGEGCVIRAGVVVGSEGFEHKRTSRGILSVVHDGSVLIGDRVELGANSCVDKGLRNKPTRIGDDTKLDNMVHVAHAVDIGRRCMLAACAMVAGSTVIGDDVWVGPNASLSSVLTVGEGAYVTLGAVVTRPVPAHARVTGNFAVPHDRFMAFLKTIR